MSAQAGMAESVTRARVLHKGAQVHRLYQKHSPEAVQRAVSGGYNEEGIVNITLDEFKAAVAYATERLTSLRGKLDLHNGTEAVGDKTHRASLIPAQLLAPVDPA
jgi:CRISPR/Cas system-associated exonuclease Cas4 (RecB family)